ncbi:sensor histidine kinase [Devosia sp.]|uniref:sensor histidine kinase n=1 Tax=Devosia sp. TaxID=1871048 RepID=UPI003A9373DA
MILILLAAGSSLVLVRLVDNHLADITETYELRQQSNTLLQALVDAETGQRGYIITGDAGYLRPYNRAIANLDETYQRLRDLVADDARQRATVEALADDIDAKRAEMARTIELVSGGEWDAARDMVRSDAGQGMMEALRLSLRLFATELEVRLADRNAQMRAARVWLVGAILASLAGCAALAFMLLTRSQRQVATMAERQAALIERKAELEAHVAERTAEVEMARQSAERERERVEALLQDTNHRIGNSLATVSSLLSLQMARASSDEVRTALDSAQSRVHAIASSHRRLRLGGDYDTARIDEFLEAVIGDLANSVPASRQISFHHEIAHMVVPARDATTLGIIVSELVTNALKHAFTADRPGQIWIRLLVEGEGGPQLVVEDDGVGFSGDSPPAGSNGLGSVVIVQLARPFGGVPTYAPREGGGTQATVPLPKLAPAAD